MVHGTLSTCASSSELTCPQLFHVAISGSSIDPLAGFNATRASAGTRRFSTQSTYWPPLQTPRLCLSTLCPPRARLYDAKSAQSTLESTNHIHAPASADRLSAASAVPLPLAPLWLGAPGMPEPRPPSLDLFSRTIFMKMSFFWRCGMGWGGGDMNNRYRWVVLGL